MGNEEERHLRLPVTIIKTAIPMVMIPTMNSVPEAVWLSNHVIPALAAGLQSPSNFDADHSSTLDVVLCANCHPIILSFVPPLLGQNDRPAWSLPV